MKKVFFAVLLFCAPALCQDAQEWIARGNAAAHSDQHAQAIEAYQKAIELDPSLRQQLLPKLARQYLWSDHAEKAAPLFQEYLKAHSEDCDVRSDYALALSWSNQLAESRREYKALRSCPGRESQARMGEARVLRWQSRPAAAEGIYRSLAEQGDENQRRDAALGIALSELAQDNNRRAREMFSSLLSAGYRDAGVAEGQAVSAMHLGLPDLAQEDLNQAKQAQIGGRQLDALEYDINRHDNFTLSPLFGGFHDGDGTNYWRTELVAASGIALRSRVEARFGASRLENGPVQIDGRWGAVAGEHRFNETLAMRGEAVVTNYDHADFTPFTGELDAIVTPADHTRMDFSLARITVWDNIAILQHHVTGIFGSASIDQRVTNQDTLSVAFDATGWSPTDNLRTRYRFSFAHHFEGMPSWTVSWPTLYQHYDQGFPFPMFSPPDYIETGPATQVYFHPARYWGALLYGRLGTQKESNLDWKLLGTFRGQIERELREHWALVAAGGFSTSNLASSTGFRRTSYSMGLTYRF